MRNQIRPGPETTYPTKAGSAIASSLPYTLLDDPDAYRIVFNIPGPAKSKIYCSLNRIESKLIVVVEREYDDSVVHYPCIFKAPSDADLGDVRVQSKGNVHVVTVSKKDRIDSLFNWMQCELPAPSAAFSRPSRPA